MAETRNYAESFRRLSETYGRLRAIAHGNLAEIATHQRKPALIKMIRRGPLARMTAFSLKEAGSLLSVQVQGQTLVLILGEVTPEMPFFASLTAKIVATHGAANFINRSLHTKEVPVDSLVVPLQEVLVEFYFLEVTFAYLCDKAEIMTRFITDIPARTMALISALDAYPQRFVAGAARNVIEAAIDHTHLAEKLRNIRFLGYSWISYTVGDDGKVVNDYLLPRVFWEPLVANIASKQASQDHGIEAHQKRKETKCGN